jgi:hypothetical protein
MVDLGIDTDDLNETQVQKLEKSVAALLETNQRTRDIETAQASNRFSIQRRGQRLPGDIGSNFGINNSSLHGFPGLAGPYGNTYPGSRYFSGMFGGNGVGGFGSGYGGSYLWTHGIQGSNALISKTTRMAHHKMSLCVSAYKGFGVAKNSGSISDGLNT